MVRSHALYIRARDALALPRCFWKVAQWKECNRSRLGIARDLLELFFSYKTFPEHYKPCRLWEQDRSRWKYYFGSNYRGYQRARLRREVQPDEYDVLFDDKELCGRLCKDTGVHMPRTYGTLRPDRDYRAALSAYFRGSAAESLFVKPVRGSAGRGIVVAERREDGIIVHSGGGSQPLSEFELQTYAIVQEAVKQDHRMAAFSSASLNTVRVLTMLTRDDAVIVVAATLRCGVGRAYVDNWSAGGVAVGVECDTGRLRKVAYDKPGNRYTRHPTSNLAFDGFVVPEWGNIVDAAATVQKAFPCYRLLGMDMALQEGVGPVLIEVNNEPDIVFSEQTSGPLLEVEGTLRAFGEYDLLFNKRQKALYEELVGGGETNRWAVGAREGSAE